MAMLHAGGRSIGYIAGEAGRDRPAICREPKGNGRHGRHGACAAQRRAEARHRRCRPKRRLFGPAPAQRARPPIADGRRPPDETDGRPRPGNGGRRVAGRPAVCRGVHAGTPGLPGAGPEGRVRRRLRRKGKGIRRKRPGTGGRIGIPHAVGERPAEAGARPRPGGREDGTAAGPGPACLPAPAGRASRPLPAGRCRHGGRSVSGAGAALPEGRPPETVAPGRGRELAGHAEAAQAPGGVQLCSCGPHHPWQKPAAENASGLLRELFPKGIGFGRVTDEEVQHAADPIDGRPRKVPKYRTASEVYREMLHSA